jgi:hypothetical protein
MKKRIAFVIALAFLPMLGRGQEVEYYHLDALGSVRAVTDASGEILVRTTTSRSERSAKGRSRETPGGSRERRGIPSRGWTISGRGTTCQL